jgi:hypothetical protein
VGIGELNHVEASKQVDCGGRHLSASTGKISFFGWGSLLILHGNMVYDGLKKIGEGIEVRRYSMGYADRQEY